MRGDDKQQAAMFSYVILEARIPADHPARQIRAMADRALARQDAEFEKLYSSTGRPSIAPERLLRATLLMVLYSIRSERQLMEQLQYNLLFRWFPPQRRRPVAGGPGVSTPATKTCRWGPRSSWAWRWTTRSGTSRYSPRTASV
jgi:hypothetical protein